MIRSILRSALRTFGIACTVLGAMLFLSADMLWRDGRLTNFACWLILGAILIGALLLIRLDYRVRTGKVNTYDLPVWLQDPKDAPEAGYRG